MLVFGFLVFFIIFRFVIICIYIHSFRSLFNCILFGEKKIQYSKLLESLLKVIRWVNREKEILFRENLLICVDSIYVFSI